MLHREFNRLIAVGLFFLILSPLAAIAENTELVSVSTNGTPADKASHITGISNDGKYVLFFSYATNLVENAPYNCSYIRDVGAGTTEILPSIVNQSVISADGRYIAFSSYPTQTIDGFSYSTPQIFVYDRQLDTYELISKNSSGGPSYEACRAMNISPNGRYVTFVSNTYNLVPGTVINNTYDIYFVDRELDIIELIGTTGRTDSNYSYNIASDDGRYVVYMAGPTAIRLYDRINNTTTLVNANRVSPYNSGDVSAPNITSDGKFVVFSTYQYGLVEGDANSKSDIYIYSTENDSIEILKPALDGTVGNGNNAYPHISEDGRFIVFMSSSTNLDPADTDPYVDTYLLDLQSNDSTVISVTPTGLPGDRGGHLGLVSNNGRFVAFDSESTDLLTATDTNPIWRDSFIRDLAVDKDGDNYVVYRDTVLEDCDDNDFNVNPGATEIPYNSFDENCNGMNDDDDIDRDGYPIASDCNDQNDSIFPGATETAFDGVDQDCNGYDLTITVDAAYKANKDILTISATTNLDDLAQLTVVGYPDEMTFSSNKWNVEIQPAGGNPGVVTVSGIEGEVTATVK